MATLSKFAQAMKSRAKAFQAGMRKPADRGGKYGPVDIPNGDYDAIVSAEARVGEKGKLLNIPIVSLTATVADGEHEGKAPKQDYILKGQMPTADGPPTGEQQLARELKLLLEDVDVDGHKPEDLETLLDEINTRLPKCRVRVNRKTGTDGKDYQSVYFNELLEASTNGEAHDEGTEESEEGAEEEEGEEEESEQEVDESMEDEVESVAPAVGDSVLYQPRGANKARKFKVKTVNQREQTCSLTDGSKSYSKVPWDKLTS